MELRSQRFFRWELDGFLRGPRDKVFETYSDKGLAIASFIALDCLADVEFAGCPISIAARCSFVWRVASVAAMLPTCAAAAGKVAAKPGENRYVYGSAAQAEPSPCKVSSEDSAGACTVFEMNALPRSGPFLHVHHCETSGITLYPASSFLKRAAKTTISRLAEAFGCRAASLTYGRTRPQPTVSYPHVQPGGFEKFFEEIGKAPMDKKSPETMRNLMAKYGMEMLGPPIFASSWMQQH